jgi:hypothetical protein
MKDCDIAANVGRICRIRTSDDEWEAVLKGRAPNNGHWEVTGPDGKTVAVTAEEIIGVKEGAADSEPGRPATGAKVMPDESWELPDLATFILAKFRRSGEDGWWIGKAIDIAHEKHKVERHWLRWLKEDVEGLSKSTAYRYMDIYHTFSLEQVKDKPLGALYKLMACNDDDDDPENVDEPEEPTSDGDNIDVSGATGGCNDEPDDADQQEPAIAGRIHSRASSAAGENDAGRDADEDQAQPDVPQPPVSASELDALAEFVEAVGGLTRAEYVFHQGIEQLRDLKDEN